MSVFRPRPRMIGFRLSEEEYEHFRELAIAQGAHSLSDFARRITQQLLEGEGQAETATLRATVRELRGKVKELDSEVKRLAELVHDGSVAH